MVVLKDNKQKNEKHHKPLKGTVPVGKISLDKRNTQNKKSQPRKKDKLTENSEQVVSPISFEKIETAVQAFKIVYKKKQESQKKPGLFDDTGKTIHLMVSAVRKIPAKRTVNVHMPNPFAKEEDGVCLFVKDLERGIEVDYEKSVEHYKDLLRGKGVNSVSEVISVRQLMHEYNPFEARRRLSQRFGIFLADSRIHHMLPSHLGKSFYGRNKLPIKVNMSALDLKTEISRAIHCTTLTIFKTGNSDAIKIGHTQLANILLSANIQATLAALAKNYPGGWENIRAIYIKSELSKAIPLFVNMAPPSSVNPKKLVPKKLKSEPIEDEISTIMGSRVQVWPDGTVKVLGKPKNWVPGNGESDEEYGSEDETEENKSNETLKENNRKEIGSAEKKDKVTKNVKSKPKSDQDNVSDSDAEAVVEAAEARYLKNLTMSTPSKKKDGAGKNEEESENESGDTEEESVNEEGSDNESDIDDTTKQNGDEDENSADEETDDEAKIVGSNEKTVKEEEDSSSTETEETVEFKAKAKKGKEKQFDSKHLGPQGKENSMKRKSFGSAEVPHSKKFKRNKKNRYFNTSMPQNELLNLTSSKQNSSSETGVSKKNQSSEPQRESIPYRKLLGIKQKVSTPVGQKLGRKQNQLSLLDQKFPLKQEQTFSPKHGHQNLTTPESKKSRKSRKQTPHSGFTTPQQTGHATTPGRKHSGSQNRVQDEYNHETTPYTSETKPKNTKFPSLKKVAATPPRPTTPSSGEYVHVATPFPSGKKSMTMFSSAEKHPTPSRSAGKKKKKVGTPA